MGLSTDPVKRRRQLEALAQGATKRAERLRELAAACDPDPRSSEAPIEAEAAAAAAASEAPIEAAIEAGGGARIVPGSYPPAPSPPAPADDVDEDEPDDVDDDQEVDDDAPVEPGLGTKLAAAALGVKR